MAVLLLDWGLVAPLMMTINHLTNTANFGKAQKIRRQLFHLIPFLL